MSLEKVANDPPATGLLVTMVIEGMPARAAALRPGDIVTAYGGTTTPTTAALHEAIAAHEDADAVPVTYVRASKERTVSVAPGRLGIQSVPVTAGEAIQARPAARKVTFSLPADDAPIEFWASFSLGDRKAGFEHHTYRARGTRLDLSYEVAFDGGAMWGVNHFLVDVVLSFERSRPETLSARFENPIAGWITEGRLAKQGRSRMWISSIRSPSGREQNEVKVPAELLPSYAVASLPLFMAPDEGACLHYTPLNEGLGVTSIPAGLLCAGPDTVGVGRARIETTRWESHSFGSTDAMTWVSPSRGIVKVTYGGPVAVMCSKDEALADLPAGIEPRTV